jgi:hypothetical protein
VNLSGRKLSGHPLQLQLSWATSLLLSIGFGPSFAAPVAIPDSYVSDTSKVGSLGGRLFAFAGSGLVGVGPRNGVYSGSTALLAPSVLTSDRGQTSITGLAIDLWCIGNNGAFSQMLTSSYTPSKHYVLALDADIGTSLLGVSVR